MSVSHQQVAVDDDHSIVGFDAAQQLIDSDVDVVQNAYASLFHPPYLNAEIATGKHVNLAQPKSIDPPVAW